MSPLLPQWRNPFAVRQAVFRARRGSLYPIQRVSDLPALGVSEVEAAEPNSEKDGERA